MNQANFSNPAKLNEAAWMGLSAGQSRSGCLYNIDAGNYLCVYDLQSIQLHALIYAMAQTQDYALHFTMVRQARRQVMFQLIRPVGKELFLNKECGSLRLSNTGQELKAVEWRETEFSLQEPVGQNGIGRPIAELGDGQLFLDQNPSYFHRFEFHYR